MKELHSNDMSTFVFDPDRETTMRILQDHLQSMKNIAEPLVAGWTESMDVVSLQYSYMSIVEYFVKHQVTVLDAREKPPVPL